MESSLSGVSPVNPIAPYLGGKRNLAKRVCTLLATIPHRTYVEPFIGMGGIFLRRTSRPPVEVINDISADVTNLFRVVRRHYEPLVEEMAWLISSRDEFDRLRRVDPDTLTDIERAARFIYLQRLAFGGKVRGRNFGVDARTPSRFNLATLRGELRALRDRLASVTIERLPYRDVIERYDTPDTLFYLDPPYWDCERDYGDGVFERADFERLAEQLAGIAGRFVLSINATAGAREVFGRFGVEEVAVTYTISTAAIGAGKSVSELLVTGPSSEPWQVQPVLQLL
ncbi:DNA adenine methylase [Sphingomonas corticis]|uniref:site-specific DNA-methyltransferase (adenine-specific) n=1 Tax=Sphingomonas corticis TaxID=2722791 RepID=A0ABX1CTR8_9SPHN|nr:DNA adenine methylase [Sphingomonas corticis]NJR80761.1 DNA adenine methylase [Sphingomonas corticis]